MMLVMNVDATPEQISQAVTIIENRGLKAHLSRGEERTVIGIVGITHDVLPEHFTQIPGVDRVMRISRPYKIASREFIPADSSFALDGVRIGERGIVVIAGPCSVEDRGRLLEIAHAVREAGGHALRGGAFKPRTSPYSFQGLGERGLEMLAEARQQTGLPIVTEVMAPEQVDLVARYADVLQIGARNMQNYALLHTAGSSQHPVLLKRGMSATIEEVLMAAEYILSHGNRRIILCERGIRTFETATRNTTDINAVPVLKTMTHLPVIVDPSHSTGYVQYVTAIARAAVAAGADGLIVEVHPRPEDALSDGGQSLRPEQFVEMMGQVRRIAEAVDRHMAVRSTEAVQPQAASPAALA